MGKIINAERSKDFECYASADLVEGRKVLDVTYIAGSYGMGGYGFFGLELGKTRYRAQEWLVCALFGAAEWLTVGDQWLAAHPAQYSEQLPLMGYGYQHDSQGLSVPTEKNWDHLKPLIADQELKKFHCENHSCKLIIGDVVLEIVEDHHKRPVFYGSKEWRQLEPDDDLRRGWIIAKDAHLLIR